MDEEFTQYIQDWLNNHKIIEKCNKGFWRCFEEYKSDSPKEFSDVFRNESRTNIAIALDKICLCLNYSWNYGKPTIQIDFTIMLQNKEIGWYREIYFTDGEFVDDFFVID